MERWKHIRDISQTMGFVDMLKQKKKKKDPRGSEHV